MNEYECNVFSFTNTIPFLQDTATFPSSQKLVTSSLQQNSSSTSWFWTLKAHRPVLRAIILSTVPKAGTSTQNKKDVYVCDETQRRWVTGDARIRARSRDRLRKLLKLIYIKCGGNGRCVNFSFVKRVLSFTFL